MVRTKLETRRISMNRPVHFHAENGKEVKMLITIGFDQQYRPKEVFCASFKAGTVMNAVVSDACILLSRLLQHGDDPTELAESMSSPPSMIGAIAVAVTEAK